MYNDKLVYTAYIWVLFGIIFRQEKEALSVDDQNSIIYLPSFLT